MKHVRIDRHFVKHEIEDGAISLTYIPIDSQEANILTKAMFSYPLYSQMCPLTKLIYSRKQCSLAL